MWWSSSSTLRRIEAAKADACAPLGTCLDVQSFAVTFRDRSVIWRSWHVLLPFTRQTHLTLPAAVEDTPHCAVVLTVGYLSRGQLPVHLRILFYDEHHVGTAFEGEPAAAMGLGLGHGVEHALGKLVEKITENVFQDFSPAIDVTPEFAKCEVIDCLTSVSHALSGVYDYHVFGPNSNSWAYTLLTNCGLSTAEIPGGRSYPGWGMLL